ncbi:palmitoyltransferase ERF2-like [Lingula anatina]|uniref:Palmitoyltransferase n=1 Tax=Lingula anatina TaxID=7574 RepID=A0A1S3HD84_LINAN|nr:palmitoyltransferase ERF2-like [Lingula anatina]|eukprot:XP_013383975.1 palmitoyltransferase ERF2-like [Lingula anatina]
MSQSMSVSSGLAAMTTGAELRERGLDTVQPTPSPPSEKLMDKWKAHYQKRKTYQPRFYPYLLRFGLPFWFLSAMCGGYIIGAFYVSPFLYSEYGPSVNLFNFCLQTFMLVQILINWFFVKTVTSFYRPSDVECAGNDVTVLETPVHLGPAKKWEKLDKEKRKYLVIVQIGNRQELFPYWGPRPCPRCNRPRPPRAHHCPICNGCILKRDHHCYFTGSCVGLRNQRHFIMLAAWSFVTLLYSFIHVLIYIPYLVEDISYWDLNIVVALIRFIFRYISLYKLIEISLIYSMMIIGFLAGGFLNEQVRIVRKGISQYEYAFDLKVINRNSTSRNIQSVFGDYWAINLLFPAHWLFPNDIDDGVSWPGVKVDTPDLTDFCAGEESSGTVI